MGRRYGTEIVLVARNEPAPPPLPMQQTAAAGPLLGLEVRTVMLRASAQREQPMALATQVVNVTPGSSADRAGLRAGDLIVQSDGLTYPDGNQVAKTMEDGHALLLVQRARVSFFAALRR